MIGEDGINVNTIVPGYFSTEMNKSSWMNKKKKMKDQKKLYLRGGAIHLK